MSSFFKRICSLFLILLLCFTQYGCDGFRNPPDSVVKDALELKIQLKHRIFDEFLDLEEDTAEILRVKVHSRSYVLDEASEMLSVSGDVDCKFPGFSNVVNVPFLVFLKNGEKGESWSLVEPSSFSNELPLEWTTFPLPIKD
jgi:hypothetical protein